MYENNEKFESLVQHMVGNLQKVFFESDITNEKSITDDFICKINKIISFTMYQITGDETLITKHNKKLHHTIKSFHTVLHDAEKHLKKDDVKKQFNKLLKAKNYGDLGMISDNPKLVIISFLATVKIMFDVASYLHKH